MQYKIKITYNTRFEQREMYLDEIFSNLSIAKKNIKSIADHYKMCYFPIEKNYKISFLEKQEILKSISHNSWFVGEMKYINKENKFIGNYEPVGVYEKAYGTDFVNLYHLLIKKDSGELYELETAWCGYHESLLKVEVVFINPTEEGLLIEI